MMANIFLLCSSSLVTFKAKVVTLMPYNSRPEFSKAISLKTVFNHFVIFQDKDFKFANNYNVSCVHGQCRVQGLGALGPEAL